MINPMDLSGKQVLVTGASSGIGKETAIHISKLGANVILLARNEENLKETIKNMEGTGHSYVCFDLKDIEGIETLFESIVAKYGKFDGMVHCAGISTSKPINLIKHQFLNDIMKINYFSFIELVRIFIKKKNSNDGASIVGMSSVASQIGDKTKTAYCATKGAMDSSIRCIAREIACRNMRINSIMPGFVKTDMYTQYISAVGEESFNKHVLSKQYLGLGEAIDVANGVAFLLSDASKFITGSGIHIDGGYLS